MVKSKVRFDGLDVAAMVSHWNRVALGRRVINIYNGPNGETYIFKLDKRSSNTNDSETSSLKDASSDTSNLLLLMESGVRFHTSQQPYDNPGMPSPFCAKLRKHLRGLRLEQVAQLGKMDRVVHLVFGSGDTQRHSLMLEFYARGNIVLTNSTYTILSLLRSHEYTNNDNKEEGKESTKDDTIQVKVGHVYPVTFATTMAAENVKDGATFIDPDDNDILLTAENPLQWFHNQSLSNKAQPAQENTSKKKKKKNDNNNSSQNSWKVLLLRHTSGVSHYGPSLLEHCLRCADLWGVDKKFPIDMTTLDEWKKLQTILQDEGGQILNDIQTQESKGYILYQEKEQNTEFSSRQDEKPPTSPFDDKILLEFQPHLLLQHQDMPRLEYTTFDQAVDIFFSHIEAQKRILRAEQQQSQAEQRLEKIRLDQEQRVISLLEQQELLQEQARLVELHADMVEKALQVVNSALDNGMDWEQLEDLVELEKTKNRNPVAMLIHKLDLEHDQMVLRLTREDILYEEEINDHNNNNPHFRDVMVSLNETAHGNATILFAKYRASKEKSKKTIEASAMALEAAEENAKRQMMEAQTKRTNVAIQAKRKPLWFEKFNWFVTSDNYLVLGGRDAQQNELLVKRYLRPGDAYLHADVHGAASCILRAKRSRDVKTGKTSPIPLSNQALREAGNFTICRSSAWSSRMVTSAWWVESHQVSKTAPTGEYLTVGSFMVRGKKNFLPPSQLEMGLGVLFRLGDDDSIARHRNERRDFALIQMNDDNNMPLEDDVTPVVIKRVEKKADKPNEKYRIDKVNGSETALASKDCYIPKAALSLDSAASDSPDKQANAVQSQTFLPSEVPSEKQTPEVDSQQDNTTRKKGLSVKERKLIKKYGSLEAALKAEDERKRQEESSDNASEITSTVISQQGVLSEGNLTNHKRGKKSKMKRIAKKYVDQDEDDRDLALLLLQGGEKDKQINKKKVPLINKKEKEAAAETIAMLTKDSAAIANQLPEKVRETLAMCVTVPDCNDEAVVKWDKFDGDVLEQLQGFEQEEPMLAAANRLLTLKGTSRIDNFSASLAGIIRTIKKYGHEGLNSAAKGDGSGDGRRKNKAEKEIEDEQWKKALANEGIVDGDDDDGDDDGLDDTVELNKLTGKPQNEDLLLFAVPVCAPYQTLSQYAYRVKLTPGNMKRGKASKQCVEMFLKDGSKSPSADRFREMIKKVVDNEWVQAICGDVKISAAGAAKAIQKSKANAKSNGGKKKK